MQLDVIAIVTIAGAGIFLLVFRRPLAELMNRYLRWFYGPTWKSAVDWSTVYTIAGILALGTVAAYVLFTIGR